MPVAVDRHDAVCDVGEDRVVAVPLERDALVELGARRGRPTRFARRRPARHPVADPHARRGRVDQDARRARCPPGPTKGAARHPAKPDVSTGSAWSRRLSFRASGDRNGSAGLDWHRPQASQSRASGSRARAPVDSPRRFHDQLVAFEQPQDGPRRPRAAWALGARPPRARRPDRCPARAGCSCARAAAPARGRGVRPRTARSARARPGPRLPGSASARGHRRRNGALLRRRRARAPPPPRAASGPAPRAASGSRTRRGPPASPRRSGCPRPDGSGQHAQAAGRRAERAGGVAEAVLEKADERRRKRVEAGEPQIVCARHQHRRARAAERLRRGLGHRIEGFLERDRLPE